MSKIFKGIALFTPGGDLVYCIEPRKQERWHLDLCVILQQILALSEPPHFLIPAYSATLDRWLDPLTQEVKIAAELYPPVQRYQHLLNALFDTSGLKWQVPSKQEEFNYPIVLETYRQQFPQLWECHEIVFRHQLLEHHDEINVNQPTNRSYILRLFVSGNNKITLKVFETLHKILDEKFPYAYSLKIIDITKYPEEAEKYQVTATPTLLRIWPEPMQRIVGEFQQSDRLLQILIR